MQKKRHIKKGDQVRAISGDAKYADPNEGKVLSVDLDNNRAVVEGLNIVSKHTKPNAQYPQGGIIKKEASMHMSNLMLIDAKGEASRTGRKKDKDGKNVRYSKKTGEIV